MGLLVVLVAVIIWFICYKWLMLSVLTTLFITISFISTLCLAMEILSVRNPKKKAKSVNRIKAKLLEENEVSDCQGEKIYNFELVVNRKKIIISKDNIHKKIEKNETIEVYPVYDENNKIIDFDYDFESQNKVWAPIVIFTIVFIILSIILILNDKTGFMNNY